MHNDPDKALRLCPLLGSNEVKPDPTEDWVGNPECHSCLFCLGLSNSVLYNSTQGCGWITLLPNTLYSKSVLLVITVFKKRDIPEQCQPELHWALAQYSQSSPCVLWSAGIDEPGLNWVTQTIYRVRAFTAQAMNQCISLYDAVLGFLTVFSNSMYDGFCQRKHSLSSYMYFCCRK